jgi:hypothetical protein
MLAHLLAISFVKGHILLGLWLVAVLLLDFNAHLLEIYAHL